MRINTNTLKSFVLAMMTMTFVTSCDKDDDSAITETVTPVVETLVLSSSTDTLVAGYSVDFLVELGVVDVTSECTFTSNGESITNPYTPSEPGSYVIVASHPEAGLSQEVTLTVQAGDPPPVDPATYEGVGEMVVNGDTYPVDNSSFYYVGSTSDPESGLYLTDIWYQFIFDGDSPSTSQNLIAVRFEAEVTDQQSYAWPVETGNTYEYVLFNRLNGVDQELSTGSGDDTVYTTTEDNGYSGLISYTQFELQTDPRTCAFTMNIEGPNTYELSYDGDVLVQNYSDDVMTPPAPANASVRTTYSNKSAQQLLTRIVR